MIERNAQVGRKILISGGGRCNFTNTSTSPENFISDNPHFCKSALARFSPEDFLRLVKKHRIAFFEKKLGQLFCRDSARGIVDMLLAECESAGVIVRTGISVTRVRKNGHFYVETSSGDFECRSLVIATGGLSFPKIGATDLGYTIARDFGLQVTQTRPSLVPLVLDGATTTSDLAGISIDSVVSVHDRTFRENVLFTHRGLSGPAILQISNYWKKAADVEIDLFPDGNALEYLEQYRDSKQTVANALGHVLPKRFAERFVEPEVASKPLNQLSRKEQRDLATRLNHWTVRFRDTEGYDRAEVTLGGVSTDQLSSQTMESRAVKGLFVIGEVVDVTGWLGGYNFQWAWSSGYAAGKTV